MAGNDAENDPFTLIAVDGYEDSADIKLAISVLGRMGLSPRVVRQYEDILKRQEASNSPYPIDDITSVQQYLGKEHFLSYRERYLPQLHGSVAARVFYLVTGKEIRERILYPDLDIKRREDTPLGKYLPVKYWTGTGRMSYEMRAAIKTQSLLDIKQRLIDGNEAPYIYGLGIKTIDFMIEMAEFLETKTQSSAGDA